MSFKTCPHCGMRLVDRNYLDGELDLEDRVLMLLQHVSPEYLEDALEASCDTSPDTCANPTDSGTLRSVREWRDEFGQPTQPVYTPETHGLGSVRVA